MHFGGLSVPLAGAALLLMAVSAAATPGRVAPERLDCDLPAPEYPHSFDTSLGGIVRIRSLVDETGKVLGVQVQESSGHASLDDAATEWARSCHFKPGTRDGVPEKVWAVQKVSFSRAGLPPERIDCSSALPPDLPGPDGAPLTGAAAIRSLVDENGKLLDVQLQKSTGNAQLDASALEWARTCRFKPGTRDGKPEKAWATQSVAFGPSGASRDSAPKGMACVAPSPEYPMWSRRYGETGTVALKYQVDAAGAVAHVAVTTSSGYPRLDEAATGWFSHCRFEDAAARGLVPDTWHAQTYTFSLRD